MFGIQNILKGKKVYFEVAAYFADELGILKPVYLQPVDFFVVERIGYSLEIGARYFLHFKGIVGTQMQVSGSLTLTGIN